MFDLEFEIPASIKITKQTTFRVLWIDSFENKKQIGECDYHTKQIVLKRGLDKWTLFWTFFHEIIHAISERRKLRITEKQVNGIEVGFSRIAELNNWCEKPLKLIVKNEKRKTKIYSGRKRKK